MTRHIDETIFNEFAENMGAEFIGVVIEAFLADAPKLFDDMRQALADRNAEVFRRSAHSLKSNCANLGTVRLTTMALELEKLGKANQLAEAEKFLDETWKEFELVKIELEKLATKPA